MVFRIIAILILSFFYAFSAFAQEDPVELLTEGIQLFEQEKYEEALEKLEKAVELEPINAEANLFLGMTFAKLDLLEEALEVFQRANKLDPENPEILLNLGITQYSFTEYGPALESLEAVLKMDPENASAQLFAGLCELALGKNEDAIRHFASSQKINPEFEQLALFNQGLAHFKNESLDKAKKLFQQAIESDPGSEMVLDAKEFLDIVKKEQRNKKRLKLFANARLITIDKVILEEQDDILEQEDVAVAYNFGADYKLFSIGDFKFQAGYNFSQQLYRTTKDFDSQSHTGFTSVAFDFKGLDVGLTYGFNYSLLDRQDFLASNSISPRIGFSFNPEVYTSFSYSYTEKNFLNGSNDRDATNHSAGINQFWFFMDSKAFIRVGYGFTLEDTQNPVFDYTAHSASMGLKLPLFAKVTGNFNYSYFYQDYKSITASIGEQRFDASHNLGFYINAPITDSFDFGINYNRLMSNSNLRSIDFVQNTFSLNLNYRF